MKTSLDHLPESKQRELARVVEILFSEFEERLAGGKAERHRSGRILKIILFGSYARGGWVEDPEGGYVSDYDILVVVNHEELTDVQEYWAKAEDHLVREYAIGHKLTAPMNFIVHSLTDVNKRLKLGRYFFTDIVRDGIALYEAPNHPFDQPRKLKPAEELAEAEGFFAEWFGTAGQFLTNATDNAGRGWGKVAAFNFHQATERLYHCLLLVLTLYSPKSHRLNFLRSQAEQLDARLIDAWPRATKFEKRCFDLLRRAYVDARYSPHYKITAEELQWLGERIAALQTLVREAYEERLADLRTKVGS
ncbi:MAG: HEPN domain-containing protein [Caulobacter sp.]|nr:HEPN domain-containing protein [Caulobacter sp.]